jgi:membrane-associated phospholipid phosphatase
MLGQIDRDFLLRLNSIIGDHEFFNKIVAFFGNDALPRGFLTFFLLAALWFAPDFDKRRARIIAGLLATCVAIFLSLFLQHFNIHTRPFLDEALSIKLFDPTVTQKWDRLSSFPSDTATLYFALDTIIFLEVSFLGAIAFLWSIITVGFVRVALGFHYPSDILGALLLGPGCVYLGSKSRQVGAQCERFLALFHSNEHILHALFLIFMAEAYILFESLQTIVHGLRMIGK